VITQVEQTPAAGLPTAINGKFLVPLVDGADFPIDTTSYLLDGGGDVDGGDISSISFAHLLAQHPQFGHVYFNPLLTAAQVAELDLVFPYRDPTDPTSILTPRLQTGRGVGGTTGQMPTHTALLAVNASVTPPRPGLIVSEEIDIGPMTSNVGADEFMVYWKLLNFYVSQDVHSDYGGTAGLNTPAMRYVYETDQEPLGFSVYITTDNGDHWSEVGLLETIAFCDKTTKFRVAFRNDSTSKVYLANFAVLF